MISDLLSRPVPMVRRIPINTKGRDFACGDIHGAFDLLWQAMKAVDFNTNQDRLFIPGDLIDRGLDSWRVLKCLRLPYVFASLGNHEIALMEMYRDGPPDPAVLQFFIGRNYNGMRWLGEISESERLEIIQELCKLPVAMEVETDRGLVGFVHADVPRGMDWQTFCQRIENGDQEVIGWALGSVTDDSRDRVLGRRSDGVKGVGRVYVGHTVQEGNLSKLGNLYAIDTGAIFAQLHQEQGRAGSKAALTMVDVRCKTTVMTALRPDIQNPIDIRDVVPAPGTPFSALEEDIDSPYTEKI